MSLKRIVTWCQNQFTLIYSLPAKHVKVLSHVHRVEKVSLLDRFCVLRMNVWETERTNLRSFFKLSSSCNWIRWRWKVQCIHLWIISPTTDGHHLPLISHSTTTIQWAVIQVSLSSIQNESNPKLIKSNANRIQILKRYPCPKIVTTFHSQNRHRCEILKNLSKRNFFLPICFIEQIWLWDEWMLPPHQLLAIWIWATIDLQVQWVLHHPNRVYSTVGNNVNSYLTTKKMTIIGTGEGGTMR